MTDKLPDPSASRSAMFSEINAQIIASLGSLESLGEKIAAAVDEESSGATLGRMTDPVHRIHGLQLQLAMAKRGMSAEQVAEACGVTRRTVLNWTAGTTKPAVTEQEVLVMLFGRYDES